MCVHAQVDGCVPCLIADIVNLRAHKICESAARLPGRQASGAGLCFRQGKRSPRLLLPNSRDTHGQSKFEPAFVQSARSSTLFQVIAREETMMKACQSSFQGYLRGIDSKTILVRVAKTTEVRVVFCFCFRSLSLKTLSLSLSLSLSSAELAILWQADLERCLTRWVAPLFDENKTNVAVTVSASKVAETVAMFKDLGRPLAVLPEALETHYPYN